MIRLGYIKQFIGDKYILIGILCWVALCAFSIGFAVSLLSTESESYIMHVNYRNEIDIVGNRHDVVMIIAIYVFIAIMDGIIAYALYMRERLLSYCVIYGMVLIMASGLWVMYVLSLLN